MMQIEFIKKKFNVCKIVMFYLVLYLIHSVVRNTRNPVYDEDFTFYGLSINELQQMSLHFVVLSFDRYSRDDVIGEVGEFEMNDSIYEQYNKYQLFLSFSLSIYID